MKTIHYTNLGKRTTLLLHFQMFMNESIWLKLVVIIRYGPTPSGKIWLEVIARWILIYEYAKEHIKTAWKGLLRVFYLLFHLVMVSNWNCQMLRGFGDVIKLSQIVIVHFARLVESTLQVRRWTERSENILHGIK